MKVGIVVARLTSLLRRNFEWRPRQFDTAWSKRKKTLMFTGVPGAFEIPYITKN